MDRALPRFCSAEPPDDEFAFLRGLLGYCQMINAGAVHPSIRNEAQKYQVRFAALLVDKQKTARF